MARPDPALTQAIIKARRTALAYAYKLCHDVTLSKDLVQSAMEATFDPNRSPWKPEVEPDLAEHLCNVVWGHFGNHVKRWQNRMASEPLTDEILETQGVRLNPESLLLAKEEILEGRQRMAMLHARVKDDPLLVILLDTDDPKDRKSTVRARESGYTLPQIELARARLRRHIEAVVADFEAGRKPTRMDA